MHLVGPCPSICARGRHFVDRRVGAAFAKMSCETSIVLSLDLAIKAACLPRRARYAHIIAFQRAGWARSRIGSTLRTNATFWAFPPAGYGIRLTIRPSWARLIECREAVVVAHEPTWAHPTLQLRFESGDGSVLALRAGLLRGGCGAGEAVVPRFTLELNGVRRS